MDTWKFNGQKQFFNVGRDLCNGHVSKVKKTLLDQLESNVDEELDNDRLLRHLISEALLRRIDHNLLDSKHIYLQKFEISQIDMFSKMNKIVPQVSASHEIANQFLVNTIGRNESATLFEIGIGKALQLVKLIQLLSKDSSSKLRSLHVIGLDPDDGNLKYSEKALNELNKKVSFTISFTGHHKLLEEFSETEFDSINNCESDVLMINAAYSFHHICSYPRTNEVRMKWLKKLKSLNPDVFTLIEPNSDHNSDNIIERIRHCYHHFYSMFESIDQSQLPKSYKYTVKTQFFGREISDIFSKDDRYRVERHETTDDWIYKLTNAGFTPLNFKNIDVQVPQYCDFELNDGLVNLGYNDENLITVFAYS